MLLYNPLFTNSSLNALTGPFASKLVDLAARLPDRRIEAALAIGVGILDTQFKEHVSDCLWILWKNLSKYRFLTIYLGAHTLGSEFLAWHDSHNVKSWHHGLHNLHNMHDMRNLWNLFRIHCKKFPVNFSGRQSWVWDPIVSSFVVVIVPSYLGFRSMLCNLHVKQKVVLTLQQKKI